ncbi:MAG: replicative DNA helicase [Parasporobacterium sp.]|nr:replicative DNA helicase [Parasporobacterium sp.]
MAEEELLKRKMPQDLRAEQSVLGSMLLDNEVIGPITEMLTGEDFYDRQYGLIFDAMAGLFRENKAVDPVTVLSRLKENGVPEEAGSEEVIKNLLEAVFSSANARQYAGIVYEKSTLRRLIRTAEEISSDCYTGKEKLDEILESTEKKIFNLVQSRNTREFQPIADIVTDVLRKIEEASKAKGHITGLPSGFADLDYKTAGLQPSDFILVAARPSMGKTAFVLTIADYVAVKKKEAVAIFSLEMSAGQLINRMLAMESQIDAQNLRSGDLSDRDWEALMESSEAIGTSNLIIDDTPGIKVSELRSKCRKYKLEQDIKLIIIDYIQLMSGSGSRGDNRQQEVSDISRGLKSLARELNVPIIVLSQLNRAVETRADHRPMLADIRESGAIEQDADVIMFLYRDDYYNEDSPDKNIAEVIIAKQRNGPTGTVKLGWQPRYTRFVNLERGDAGSGF